MFYEIESIYSAVRCCSLLGIVIVCCLSTEGFSHAVQWPSGKYGLPMSTSGCPKANGGFVWDTGYIYQDLEVSTTTSQSFHLQAQVMSSGDVSRRFCMKTNETSDTGRPTWPFGNYCIYMKDTSCPVGLSKGWVLWDDDNGMTGNNLNFQQGSLPKGKFDQDTKIFFCCQTYGSADAPIELPIDTPFYLIAYNGKRCQEVLKTIHTTEFIRYDTEDDNNHNSQAYLHPYGADRNQPYIYYCYYTACRWTMTALSGTFSSPNYPFQYKNYAWCEWFINVPQNYIISLEFVDFRLETIDLCVTASCECDYVEVRETLKNGTSVLIGIYCMGVSYPYGNITSRGNSLVVVFRSDSTITTEGFTARYQAIPQATAPTTLSTVTASTSTGTDSANNTSGILSSTTGVKWTITTPSSNSTSEGENSTRATTSFTKQSTTSPFTTDEQTTASMVSEPSKESPKTNEATSAETSTGATDSVTVDPGRGHQASQDNPNTANVLVIVAVTASLVAVAIAVIVLFLFYCIKRKPKGNEVGRDRLTVSFTAAEKTYGISNIIPNMYSGSEQNDNERYIETAKLGDVSLLGLKENLNDLNRTFADSTTDREEDVEDYEIKESDNPLYSSRLT